MNLTNKLFSLLGFAEPITLKRFNGKNSSPKKLLLLSINTAINDTLVQAINPLSANIVNYCDPSAEKNIDALVIDATNYIDETSYHSLYKNVKNSLKVLANNARVLLITNTSSTAQSTEQNAFSQAVIGFTKSLAKEIGRKGSTANIILIDEINNNNKNSSIVALANPLQFFLSANSAFVSGQVIKINNQIALPVHTTTKKNRQQIAVVTGAAQGIGAAISHTLTNKGYFVIGVDIEPMKSQLISTMGELQGQAFILDVSAKDAGEQLTDLANKHGGFDVMVHNAGITRDKTLAKMPEHFWQQTIAINLLSVMTINSSLISHKAINEGGRIICLSSMNGIAGQGGQTNYACSKAGIIGYVTSMACQLAKYNITLNAVAPGFIDTKMTEKIPFFTREMGRRMNALGQGGLPVDVAETIAFLGSRDNIAVSGQTIRVCGLNIIGA